MSNHPLRHESNTGFINSLLCSRFSSSAEELDKINVCGYEIVDAILHPGFFRLVLQLRMVLKERTSESHTKLIESLKK